MRRELLYRSADRGFLTATVTRIRVSIMAFTCLIGSWIMLEETKASNAKSSMDGLWAMTVLYSAMLAGCGSLP